MQDETRMRDLRILIEVIDAGGIEGRRPALDAMDVVAFGKQQFREVGAVLTRDAGDQGSFVA